MATPRKPAGGRTTPRKAAPEPQPPMEVLAPEDEPTDDGAEVFDLDAFEGDARDRKPPFLFRFGGEDYELPGNPSILAVMDIESGRLEAGLRKLLGPEQFARMVATDAVMDEPRLTALLVRWQRHLGLAPGNSKASPGSSRTTARRSKRTSSATTAFR